MLKLRKFLPKDLEQVLEINQASFLQPWPKDELEKLYQKHPDGFIVAEDSGKIAGFVVGMISKNQGKIKLIAVNPDYRGKGVGRNLMEHIFNYFAENEVKEVMAHSRIHNESGCAFLKSFGFKIIETVENYYLKGEAAYLMKKGLDG